MPLWLPQFLFALLLLTWYCLRFIINPNTMKTLTLSCIALLGICISLTTYAQPVILSQNSYGGRQQNVLYDLKKTFDNGLILGGNSNSEKGFGKAEPSRGLMDYWIIKLDSTGNRQWNKTLGGNLTETLASIVCTNDKGFLAAGYSASDISGEKTQTHYGLLYSFDFWIVKTDSLGNKIWDKTIGGDQEEYLYCADTTNDGGYILGGVSNSNISGDKTHPRISATGPDFWVVKLDKNGNILWDKTIGCLSSSNLVSIHPTKDGGYILSGSANSEASGDKTETGRGGMDIWVVKLDGNGNVVWDKTLGGTLDDWADNVIESFDGGYMCTGYSGSPASFDKSQPAIGEKDFWIIKLDANGKRKYDRCYGGLNEDVLHASQQTKDSGWVLAGDSYSDIGGNKTEPRRGPGTVPDYWVIKINKYGNVEWDKTIGARSYDNCFAITEINRNNYAVGGISESGISGDKTVPSRGYIDYWLVLLHLQNLNATTSNAIALQKTGNSISTNFSIYPNPAINVVNVRYNGKAAFSLTSADGKVVVTKSINGSGQLAVSDLPAGVYYLQNTKTGAQQKLVIK